MKKFRYFLLTLGFSVNLSIGTAAISGELDEISIITPISYKNTYKFSNFPIIKGKSSSLLAFIQDKTHIIDISSKVLEKIEPYRAALTDKYFPRKNELDNFIREVVKKGVDQHLIETTDNNLIQFYKYMGNQLIGGMADKILEAEGVTDSTRRSLWTSKLVSPFNQCINKAKNFLSDADHCLNALQASLVPNIAMGIVYELSKTNLSSALPKQEQALFNQAQANNYTACLFEIKGELTPDISKKCALETMKNGVKKIASFSLDKKLNEKASSKKMAVQIKTNVWPAFDTCLKKIGNDSMSKLEYKPQFLNCIDLLVRDAGSYVVQDTITTNDSIKKNLGPTEGNSLAADMSKLFRNCVDKNIATGIRKDGIVDSTNCEREATNKVTYKIVSMSLKKAALENLLPEKSKTKKMTTASLKASKLKAELEGKKGIQILNKCWSDLQGSEAKETCLRQTIIEFSKGIASIKFDESIPQDIEGKQELYERNLDSLAKCIDNSLPLKIAEAKDPTANIGQCSNMITAQLGKEVTKIAFKKKVYKKLSEIGTLEEMSITSSEVDLFLENLNKSNALCIDQKSNDPIDEKVNACIKSSIKEIAFYIGIIKLKKGVDELYIDRPNDQKMVEKTLQEKLGKCLDEKNGNIFSVTDYIDHIDECSDRVNYAVTSLVGKDQISFSVNNYLKDRPKIDQSQLRNEIRSSLLAKFDVCMKNPTQIAKCTDDLKREATQKILLSFATTETKLQLNSKSLPKELSPIFDKFSSCSSVDLKGDELSDQLDNCVKDFALSFARGLGEFKFQYLLKTNLGSKKYNEQKSIVDDALNSYQQCLKPLEKYPTKKVIEYLTSCTDRLTRAGVHLVKYNVKEWMIDRGEEPKISQIKESYAEALPCISAILPPSPFNPNLEENIDASLKVVSAALADFIEYNPENAQQTFAEIVDKLRIDFNNEAATTQAKKELLTFLYKNKVLDQFIKATIFGLINEAINSSAKGEEFPSALKEFLLDKSNLDAALESKEGESIKKFAMEKILSPYLIDQVDLKSPTMKKETSLLKDSVVRLLIDSPAFGEKLIRLGVQDRINNMNKSTKFFAKLLYGEKSLNWEISRQTAEGKEAEKFIKEKIVQPKFEGKTFSKEEQRKIEAEAKDLVTKAVKKADSYEKIVND